MKLFNIICNIYTLTPIDGGTKTQCLLEKSSVVGCDSLSEVKEEMRNRFNNYFNPTPSGRLWDLKTVVPFCGDSYRYLVFDMLVPAECVVGERREFYITKAII